MTDEEMQKARAWLVDCYNPLSTRSSVDKLTEAHGIISGIVRAAAQQATLVASSPPEEKF